MVQAAQQVGSQNSKFRFKRVGTGKQAELADIREEKKHSNEEMKMDEALNNI